jgi:hypothetical protein
MGWYKSVSMVVSDNQGEGGRRGGFLLEAGERRESVSMVRYPTTKEREEKGEDSH